METLCTNKQKTKDQLTPAEKSITLDFINPPDKANECKEAFKKAGFTTVTIQLAAHREQIQSRIKGEVQSLEGESVAKP